MIGTAAGLRAYADARGFVNPNLAVDTLANQALQRASDYIEFHYLSRFAPGYDVNSPGVEPATYEAALLELDAGGFFNRTWTPGERKTLTEVSGIRWEVLPGSGPNKDPTPISSRIEALLSRYINAGGLAVYVV